MNRIGTFFNISTTWFTVGSVIVSLASLSMMWSGFDNDAWRLALLVGVFGSLVSLILNIAWYGVFKGIGLTLLQILAAAGVVLVYLFWAIRQPGRSYPDQSAPRPRRTYTAAGGVVLPGLRGGQNTIDN